MISPRIPMLIVFLLSLSTVISAQYIIKGSIGSQRIDGDVKPLSHTINNISLGINNQITKRFGLEGTIGYGRSKGINNQFYTIGSKGGGLVEDIYFENDVTIWIPSFATKYGYLDLGVNFTQYFFQDQFFIDFGLGLGVSGSSTYINLYDSNGVPYSVEYIPQPISNFIESIVYDDDFETKFDEGSFLNRHYFLKAGLNYKITDKGFLGLSMRYQIGTTDYLDPIKYRTLESQTHTADNIMILSFSYLHILGSGKKE